MQKEIGENDLLKEHEIFLDDFVLMHARTNTTIYIVSLLYRRLLYVSVYWYVAIGRWLPSIALHCRYMQP